MLNLSRSCDMGIATSCSMVGYSYIHGCGVAKDTEKGRQLLSRGCSLGDHNACDGIN
jgi:TPR repeat protein